MFTKKYSIAFPVIFTFLVLFLISCSAGNYSKKRNLTVAFYNVENLFDTISAPKKNDAEFTPGSEKKWTAVRYSKKVNDISKVLAAINKNELPEIIGLCEVENRKVLEDLIGTESLKSGKYAIAHFESPDFRGIDCALIYRPDEFKVLESKPVKVSFSNDARYTTRDILYVKGRTKNREEFHIFVNHWPSRIGGMEETEQKRVAVATILKNKIDSVRAANSDAKIIVMGDMNDEPSNNSLAEILKAQSPGSENARLVNLMSPLHDNKLGSYNYQGNWNMLDNVIVSDNLLDKKGFQCVEKQGVVFHEPWMEFKNKKGEISPNRTYGGSNYYGGVSDHFPVYFQLSR